MLSAAGVIAEFNPFHNGHRYLLQRARRLTGANVVIVVMSGNWVQRGIPAIADKWQRTRMALDNGADLVIELPAQFAVQPADIFAFQAVKLINHLHCKWLAFGCEHPSFNFDYLAGIKLKTSHHFFQNYKDTYATLIRRNFYKQTGLKITEPNDLLALSYARAKRKLGTELKLLPIQRSSSHDNLKLKSDSLFTSSTSIRKQLSLTHDINKVSAWMPKSCVKLMNSPWMNWSSFWPWLRYRLIESSLTELRQVYQMREGLEHRLKRAAIQADSFSQFIHLVKTKRYTYSSILRVCFYVLINLTKTNWIRTKGHSYLRILGFDAKGRKYLNQIKKKASLPIITNATQDALQKYLMWDFRTGMLFQMKLNRYEDLYRHPVIK